MENVDVNISLSKYSPVWSNLCKQIEKNSNVNIVGMGEDYLGLLLRNVLGKRVAVVCDDQIKAGYLNRNLKSWGVNSVLLPCSWTQLTLEELENINRAINDFFANKNVVLVVSMEEWEKEWMYKHNGVLDIITEKEYGFVDL